MQIHPENAEDYVNLLVDMGQYSEAVKRYMEILDNPRFQSKEGKSNFQLWTEMVDLLVSKAKKIETGPQTGIDVDAILRSGIDRFADQRGKLWAGLATYWITKGNFEKARDVFEEGITTVMTVRDFTLVFDSYVEFEESIIGNLMEAAAVRTDNGQADEEADFDLDLRMLRFEQLMDRRPFLVNDVLLRQNPNNVIEWEKRVALWGDNNVEIVQTYTAAIAAINPKKAVGKFSELWVNYAKFYERGGDLGTARVIFEKAVKVPFKSVAELAETWCEFAEMELRSENFDQAVEIMAKATQAPKKSTVDYFDETLSPQQRVHKSWKLWSFYVDLVESVSSIEETKKVYERIFELRIATPQTVVNFANLLEEHKYFEDSFKVYERGLDLFTYPVAFELWNLYLTKAVDRKIGIERLRDLFEQALDGCPPKFAKPLYLMYGNLEEERGLARHAMRIYERATRAVSDEDRFEMFEFYITKSASNFGLTSTRPIYERAIAALPDQEAKEMCLKFAEMERRLGEIDRARAIYGHASQFCDPRTNAPFWQKWEAFEVQHGNEDTFKEMLRIKRSVQAQYKYVSPTPPKNMTATNKTIALMSTSLLPKLSPAANKRLQKTEQGSQQNREKKWIRQQQMPWQPWNGKLVRRLASSQPVAALKAATAHLLRSKPLRPLPLLTPMRSISTTIWMLTRSTLLTILHHMPASLLLIYFQSQPTHRKKHKRTNDCLQPATYPSIYLSDKP
jgi:pre-mRNA-splicing factor SYF1